MISNNHVYLNMYWHCEICDKIRNEKFRIKHLESKFHSSLVNSILGRYIISKSAHDKIEDTVRKYLRFHYGKDNNFRIVFLLKSMPSNKIKYTRSYRSSRYYKLQINVTFFFSKTKSIKEQFCSQILELIITFFSLSKNITFDHYLTKPKPML